MTQKILPIQPLPSKAHIVIVMYLTYQISCNTARFNVETTTNLGSTDLVVNVIGMGGNIGTKLSLTVALRNQ